MKELNGSSAHKTFEYFEKINQIPRCSNDEDRIAKFLEDLGKDLGFESFQDKVGNVIMRKPASPGYEDHPMVALQAHMDMVCEKTLTCPHDFSKDPIDMYIEDGFIKAKGTTLGADDGIGIALALDIMTSEGLDHPALELLITRTEETGMDGVIGLDGETLKSRTLINIDTEDEGIIIIGCAGGISAFVDLPISYSESLEKVFYRVEVSGLKGGHSGSMIGSIHLNAIKLLNEILKKINSEVALTLSSFNGGSKHNAIPSSAEAVIAIDPAEVERFEKVYEALIAEIYEVNLKKEADLKVALERSDDVHSLLTKESTNNILNLNGLLPHGINSMTPGIPDLVESSNNLAIVSTEGDSYKVVLSVRSTNEDQKQILLNKIKDAGAFVKAEVSLSDGYVMWKPNFDSALLKVAMDSYRDLKDEEVMVKTIHAGLETGMIAEKYPEMDMISLGPDVRGGHTPEERLSIKSCEFTREYLIDILKRL